MLTLSNTNHTLIELINKKDIQYKNCLFNREMKHETKTIYYDEDSNEEMTITNFDEYEAQPFIGNGRFSCFISGGSGSGKSVECMKLIMLMKNILIISYSFISQVSISMMI